MDNDAWVDDKGKPMKAPKKSVPTSKPVEIVTEDEDDDDVMTPEME